MRFFLAFFLLCTLTACASQRTEVSVDASSQSSVSSFSSFSSFMNAYSQFSKPNDAELKSKLTEIQYDVTQREGTEPPFDNEYWHNEEEGIYVDVVSGEPLFSSTDKFDSGTGWPSFTKPLVPENINEETDYKLIYPRTEVRSKLADSHLGHVFNDGPEPTGLRYCMNSAAMRFVPKDELSEQGYGEYEELFK